MAKPWHLAVLCVLSQAAPLILTDADEPQASKSWLEDWLWNLQLQIPDISEEKGGFNFTISDGLCTHFKIAKIDTKKMVDGLDIQASGLEISCRLQWKANRWLHGDVVAQVKGGSIGGPIALVSDGLRPPLPKAIDASRCAGSIKADLSFGGSGVSTVLEFLKPLIEGYLNQRLSVLICGNVDKLIEGQGSEALRNVSGLVREMLRDGPTPPPTPVIEDPRHDLVDLTENSGVELLHSVVTKVLGNRRSPHSANALLERYLGSSGNLSLDSLVTLPYSHVIELQAGRLNITIESATLSHLNTVSAMDLYSPEPQELQFLLSLKQLALHARFLLGAKPHGSISGDELRESFEALATMADVSLGGLVFMALNGTRLNVLGADQLSELGCLAGGIDALEALRGDLEAQVSCELAPTEKGDDLEHDVDRMLNAAGAQLLGSYQEALQAVGHDMLITKALDVANSKLASTLQTAGACPPPFEDYSNMTLSFVAFMGCLILFLASLAVAVGACLLPKRVETRACASNSVASTGSTGTDPTSLNVETGTPPMRGEDKDTSLAFHPRIGPGFRWGLPLLMVATMLLFLSSNSNIGAVVRVVVTANGRPVADIPPVFGFSLIGSIKDMCDGKVYALALLIICFSGLWPYLKPMLMMMCWFMPPQRLSVAKRQQLLNFLDAFGKWSLVDTFVMILFMVAFKFDLSGTKGPGLLQDILRESNDDASFQVQVEALFGFYSFLVATFMSLILGHITTACHRYAHKLGEYGVEGDVLQKRRLCYVLCSSRCDVHGPTVAISVSLLLVLCGSFLETFNFNFLGLAGYALGPDQHRPFSVFSLGLKIPEASPDPGSALVLLLQGVFFLFAIIVVVAYHVILIVLWVAPMTTRMQKQFFLTAQVLNAWSGLDVFCVTILAGVLEIRQFADFIVGDKCDFINKMLAKSPLASEMPGGAMTCFDVDSTLRAGFLVLAAAVVISTVTGQVMLAKCGAALCAPPTS